MSTLVLASVLMLVGTCTATSAHATNRLAFKLVAKPAAITTTSTAVFRLSTRPSGARYKCRVDSAPFATCKSSYKSLGQGSHTFRARAVRGSRKVDVVYRWVVDRTKPTLTIGGSSTTGATGLVFQSGSTTYVNTNAAGNVSLAASANDAHGIATVSFPDADFIDWTNGALNDASAPYAASYSFVAHARQPSGGLKITATDRAGNSTSIPVALVSDTTAPDHMSAAADLTGFTTAAQVMVTPAPGDDLGGSGVASWQLLERRAPLSAGTCGSFLPKTVVGPVSPTAAVPVSVPAADSSCQRFGIGVRDNVGNYSETFAPGIVMVDRTAPGLPVPSGGQASWVDVPVPIDAGGASDAGSGVDHFIYQTSTNAGANWTNGLVPSESVQITADGITLVRFAAVDVAGNTGAYSLPSNAATAQIDTTAPTASIDPVPTGSINSNVDFVGDLYDNGSGLVNSQWSVSSGGPSTPITDCTFTAGATRYVCHWDTTGLSAGHYTLALHAVDGLAHATDAPAAGIDLS